MLLILQANIDETVLDLQDHDIEPAAAESLANALQQLVNNKIEVLLLKSCKLDDDSAIHIASILQQNT